MPTFIPTDTRPFQEFKLGRPLIGCRFDPSGRYLFVSTEDNTIRRIDLFNGSQISFEGHKSWVRGIAFLSNGKVKPFPTIPMLQLSSVIGSIVPQMNIRDQQSFRMFTGDYHGNIIEWEGASEKPSPIRTIEGHDGWVRSLVVSPDGKTVASCGNDHLVKLWSTENGKLIRVLKSHTCHAYNVAFHPDGTHLVSADLEGIVKDWDLAKGEVVRTLEAKELSKYDNSFKATIGGIRSMTFNPDGSYLACAGITNVSNAFAGVGNPLVVLFDWKTGKPKQQLKPKAAFQGTAWGVAFHSSGVIIGSGGGSGGQIWFWKPEDANSFHMVALPQSARDMALHPNGELLAFANSDGIARIYTMTPKPPERPKPKESPTPMKK
jgi:WD40 repeat protein